MSKIKVHFTRSNFYLRADVMKREQTSFRAKTIANDRPLSSPKQKVKKKMKNTLKRHSLSIGDNKAIEIRNTRASKHF